ncbi:MAG: hypothetical protein RLZZ430_305, partial [Cyanobacteriota bacterium]
MGIAYLLFRLIFGYLFCRLLF